jgi:hypothetical protein
MIASLIDARQQRLACIELALIPLLPLCLKNTMCRPFRESVSGLVRSARPLGISPSALMLYERIQEGMIKKRSAVCRRLCSRRWWLPRVSEGSHPRVPQARMRRNTDRLKEPKSSHARRENRRHRGVPQTSERGKRRMVRRRPPMEHS